jgi:RNA polymerase sigma factor (sigma-70 family)
MPEQGLLDWIRNSVRRFCQMRSETIVFLLLHFRRSDNPQLVEELGASLEARMKTQILHGYLTSLGHQLTEDLISEVCSRAWTVLLESPHDRGIWMQLCFDRFILNLCRDVLRKQRTSDLLSYDSNAEIRNLAMSIESPGPSAEDMVYLREVLSQLKPRQCQVFLMQHGLNECQQSIALKINRSNRSVRSLLKQAELRLKAVS